MSKYFVVLNPTYGKNNVNRNNIMLATQVRNNIPANLKNLNERFVFGKNAKNAWTYHVSHNLNNIRRNGWNKVKRNDMIKFIMYAYYGTFNDWIYHNGNNSQINNFHRAYSKISTRNSNNKSMISPSVLWRRLQALGTSELIKFAEIIEW